MHARAVLPLAAAAALCAAGCGGDRTTPRAASAEQTAPPATPNVTPDLGETRRAADPSAVRVISAWTDAERSSDLARATSYFAVPALVENGAGPEELTSRAAVLQFHRELPCGARLLRTSAATKREYVVATFQLVDRPGVSCDGTGARAQTAFRVRGGKIYEWLRLPDLPRSGRGTPAPPSTPRSGSQAA